jgi:hypothetical protein
MVDEIPRSPSHQTAPRRAGWTALWLALLLWSSDFARGVVLISKQPLEKCGVRLTRLCQSKNHHPTTTMSLKRVRSDDNPDGEPKRQNLGEFVDQKTTILKFSSSSVPPDVSIMVFSLDFRLHSTILRHHSAFFDKSLSSTWWREENTHDRVDGIKYCYKLQFDSKDPDLSMVEPVAAVSLAERVCHSTVLNNSVSCAEEADIEEANLAVEPESSDTSSESPPSPSAQDQHNLKHVYCSLFGVFYNETRALSRLKFPRIQKLVALADQYCCLRSVSGAVELLLYKSPDLATNIAKDPVAYLQLGQKIRSRSIYDDAFVHLVGQLDSFWEQKDQLPPQVLKNVLDEYHCISKLKSTVDRYAASFVARPGTSPSKSELRLIGAEFEKFCRSGKRGEGTLYRKLREGFVEVSEVYVDQNIDSRIIDTALAQLVSSSVKLGPAIEYDHLTCASPPKQYPWNPDSEW